MVTMLPPYFCTMNTFLKLFHVIVSEGISLAVSWKYISHFFKSISLSNCEPHLFFKVCILILFKGEYVFLSGVFKVFLLLIASLLCCQFLEF